MSRIDRLMIQGWMPFRDQVNLHLPAGPIAVVARYRNNPRRSNWAGKTALIEAIGWCLFGVHRKRLDDDVINSTQEACTVEVQVGDLIVRRHRKRGAATVLTVMRGEAESMRGTAAQQFLIQHLGVSFDDYVATVDFRQDDIESIVGMRTGKRREVIAAWLRMERWTLAAKRATERARAAQQKLSEARVALTTVKGMLMDTHQIALAEAELTKHNKRAADARATIVALAEQIKSRPNPDALGKAFFELRELRATVVRLKPLLAARADVAQAVITAREGMAKLRLHRDQKKERLNELGTLTTTGFDCVCPVMCEACPVADQVGANVDQFVALHRDAEAELKTAQDAYDEGFQAVRPMDAQLRELDQQAGTYNAAVKRGKELAAVVQGYTESDANNLLHEVADLGAQQDRAQLEYDIAQREGAALQQKLASDSEHRKRVVQLEGDVAAAEREARVVALMQKALGPTGVPARIARVHIAQLEASANELLQDSGLSLEFGWERPTKDLAPLCMECGYAYVGQREKKCPKCEAVRGPKFSDELEILVDDRCGEIEDVKAKSGGARVLVASALRLAASAMLREVRGTPVAWSTIDEPFGPLDAENREALARVFHSMLGSVGLEQAFVVSHDQALLDQLPHRLIIERGDDASVLRLESAA